jgi:hypothetical protein
MQPAALAQRPPLRCLQVIAGVLAAEADADLIVITGDIVSGWLSDGAKDWVQQRWAAPQGSAGLCSDCSSQQAAPLQEPGAP